MVLGSDEWSCLERQVTRGESNSDSLAWVFVGVGAFGQHMRGCLIRTKAWSKIVSDYMHEADEDGRLQLSVAE